MTRMRKRLARVLRALERWVDPRESVDAFIIADHTACRAQIEQVQAEASRQRLGL